MKTFKRLSILFCLLSILLMVTGCGMLQKEEFDGKRIGIILNYQMSTDSKIKINDFTNFTEKIAERIVKRLDNMAVTILDQKIPDEASLKELAERNNFDYLLIANFSDISYTLEFKINLGKSTLITKRVSSSSNTLDYTLYSINPFQRIHTGTKIGKYVSTTRSQTKSFDRSKIIQNALFHSISLTGMGI